MHSSLVLLLWLIKNAGNFYVILGIDKSSFEEEKEVKVKNNKKMQAWSKYRQEGKTKYIHTKSLYIAAGVLVGSSLAGLLKKDWMFFSLSNIMLIFLVTYFAARVGAAYFWKKNEEKYSQYIEDKKD